MFLDIFKEFWETSRAIDKYCIIYVIFLLLNLITKKKIFFVISIIFWILCFAAMADQEGFPIAFGAVTLVSGWIDFSIACWNGSSKKQGIIMIIIGFITLGLFIK